MGVVPQWVPAGRFAGLRLSSARGFAAVAGDVWLLSAGIAESAPIVIDRCVANLDRNLVVRPMFGSCLTTRVAYLTIAFSVLTRVCAYLISVASCCRSTALHARIGGWVEPLRP